MPIDWPTSITNYDKSVSKQNNEENKPHRVVMVINLGFSMVNSLHIEFDEFVSHFVVVCFPFFFAAMNNNVCFDRKEWLGLN